MKVLNLILVTLFMIVCTLASGCIQTPQQNRGEIIPPVPDDSTHPAPDIPGEEEKITTSDLIGFVSPAVAYAREMGKEKAIAAFNDPNGQFVQGDLYIFAYDYNGFVLAEPFHPEIVGTDARNFTDRYGVPVTRNMAETARFGIGYVSCDNPNPKQDNALEPTLSVVADIDGTYYIGAGMYSSNGKVYPSVVIAPAIKKSTTDDLIAFVKSAVKYAQINGKEGAINEFRDANGQFVQGEMAIMAFDFNGTNLAGPPYSPELSENSINLINYHDPDSVATIREMRDLAKMGGGISYTVAKVSVNGSYVYVPKIDYAEPVDKSWWIFAGIINPDYSQIRYGNFTGVITRDRTRSELYDLVNSTVQYARIHGKENTLTGINNPGGQFVDGDLFIWAESFDGTILADPFLKDAIGKNFIDYTDPYGQKTTIVAINTIREGTGFSHAMFPDTAENGTKSIPKLVYMKAVDEEWWIGSGIYGVEVG